MIQIHKISNLVIGIATIGLSLLIYIYLYVYRGTTQEPAWYTIHCFLPAIAVTLLLRLSGAGAAAQVVAAGILLVMLAAAYISEIALTERVSQYERIVRNAALNAGREYDPRDLPSMIAALRAGGQHAFPPAGPSLAMKEGPNGHLISRFSIGGKEILPLGGVGHAVIVNCKESGQWAVNRTDKYGFFNPADLWTGAPVTLAVLGGSDAAGFCLPWRETMHRQFRDVFQRTLNLAMPDDGILLKYATLKEYLERVKPKIVVLFVDSEDFEDWEQFESRAPLLLRYKTDDFRQDLPARQDWINSEWSEYLAGRLSRPRQQKFASIVFLRNVRDQAMRLTRRLIRLFISDTTQDVDRWRPTLRAFDEILVRAHDTVTSWNGRFIVVLHSVVPFFAANREYAALKPEVVRILDCTGIETIDLQNAFDSYAEPQKLFLIPDRDSHLSPHGQKLVADIVIDHLRAPAKSLTQRRAVRTRPCGRR